MHAAVDGGSNFVVYCTVALDKKAITLFRGYAAAVQQYGRPVRVRADMCFEAVPIGQDIINNRGSTAAYIAGPSTANTVGSVFSLTTSCIMPCMWRPHCIGAHWVSAACGCTEDRELLELHVVALCVVLQAALPGPGATGQPGQVGMESVDHALRLPSTKLLGPGQTTSCAHACRSNAYDMFSLQQVFLPVLQQRALEVCDAW